MQPSVVNFLRKEYLPEILARYAAVTNLATNGIARSSGMRASIASKGIALPKNPSEVMKLVMRHYALTKAAIIKQFTAAKQKGQCFSISTIVSIPLFKISTS